MKHFVVSITTLSDDSIGDMLLHLELVTQHLRSVQDGKKLHEQGGIRKEGSETGAVWGWVEMPVIMSEAGMSQLTLAEFDAVRAVRAKPAARPSKTRTQQ